MLTAPKRHSAFLALAAMAAMMVVLAGYPAVACLLSGDPELDRCQCLDPCGFGCKAPLSDVLLSRVIIYLSGFALPFTLSAFLIIAFYAGGKKEFGRKKRALHAAQFLFLNLIFVGGTAILLSALMSSLAAGGWILLIAPALFAFLLWLCRKNLIWWKTLLFTLLALSPMITVSMLLATGTPESIMHRCFYAR